MIIHSTPHITQDNALVHLRLARVVPTLDATVEDINRACDMAEDAGLHAALILHVRDSARTLSVGGMDMPLHSQWERALRRIETLRAPTACVVDGTCFGLMLEVLLCTDYRAVTDHLQLGLAHLGDTLWPSMAVHRLALQLGVAQARQLVLFDRPIGSSRALDLGLVHSVSSDPAGAAQGFLASLRTAGVHDVSIRRQLLLEAPAQTHEAALGTHMVACSRALRRETPTPGVSTAAVALENR